MCVDYDTPIAEDKKKSREGEFNVCPIELLIQTLFKPGSAVNPEHSHFIHWLSEEIQKEARKDGHT